MKVAMICMDASGGHPLYVDAVLTAISRLERPGLQVELVAPVNLDSHYSDRPYAIHKIIPAYPERGRMPRLLWRIKQSQYILKAYWTCMRWVKQQRFDAIHFQGLFWLSVLVFPWYRRIGIPLFFTIHNIRPHRYSGLMPPRMEDAISRWMWRQCDGLFVHTEKLRQSAAEFLGFGHPPIYVAPHGCWERSICNVSSMPLTERLERKKALFFGNIRRDKGLHHFLAAMENMDGYSLTIAGNPIEKNYWQEVILPLIEHVRRMGRNVNVIQEYIAEECIDSLFLDHSFVVLPYTRDFQAQSGVLYMALSRETPVVASDVGGIEEAIMQWDVGEVAPPEDPEAFTYAVARLYKRNPEKLQQSLKTASETPQWQEAAQAICDAYYAFRYINLSNKVSHTTGVS